MRFHYPLQKIVDLKGSEKSMAEWEYAASLGALRTEEERLEDLARERSLLDDKLTSTFQEPVPLGELLSIQQYIETLEDRIRSQQVGVHRAKMQAESSRSNLETRMIDEKVWQNARGRAFERYRQDRQSKDQNELDEIAIRRTAFAFRS